MKSEKKRAFALCAALLACGIFGNAGYSRPDFRAEAACSRQNIFNETLEEDSLEDNNRWVLAKKDSTAIGVGNVGKNTICVTPGGMVSSLQYDEKIVLQGNQYVEVSFTFENMPATAVLDFRFSAEKATDAEEHLNASKEGVSLYADPGWLRGVLISENAQTMYGGWGNTGGVGTAMGLQWVNGDASVGAPNASNGKYKIKARYYEDGTAIFYTANPYGDNYFHTAFVGLNPSTFEKVPGFRPLQEGYLQLMIRNAGEAYIGEAEVCIYDYQTKGSPATGIEDGVPVGGSRYSEAIEENASFRFLPFGGSATVRAATKAILVNNAADDDFIVKKTKLSKPDNLFAEQIYSLSAQFVIPELEGTAKAVVYIGGDTQTDFTDAATLEFSKTENGVIRLTAGGTTVDTSLKTGETFDLLVSCGNDFVNEIYLNGAAVPVPTGGTLRFEKDVREKFIAFGTKGVGGANKASIGITSADFKKFNYQQGEGGDFTETFDGGKYNKGNIVFGYRVENIQDFFYADAENGSLVVNNVGYTGVVSSRQSYGDFEFTFEISEFLSNRTETGEILPPNFMISWGRPVADADYVSGGCGVFIKDGNDLNLMGDATYAAGYGRWFTIDLPTDKKDENGNPMEKASAIWDYDFSQGNLVFKTVKKDTTVSFYLYTADSPEDDPSRTVPICVLVDDYSSAGMVGLCGVPTGMNMSLKIDSFSVRNTDAHQLENLVTGSASDVVDLDLTPEEPDPPIDDPFDKKESASDSVGKKGCGSSVDPSGFASAFLAAAVFAGMKRRSVGK